MLADYEATLGTTVLENIVIRNGKKVNHNKVSYNRISNSSRSQFKKITRFTGILYFVY